MKISSYIEISKSAYRQNLELIHSMIGNECFFSSVVKGNAYGHGIEVFVPMAESCGVGHFSVFCAGEALKVKKVSNGRSAVVIMGMIDDAELDWAVTNGVEFFVFDVDRLKKAITIASRLKKKAKVHIEVETGLNRTGFDGLELPEVAVILKENQKNISTEGICTHLAGAESIANYLRIKKQIIQFNKLVKWFAEQNITFSHQHAACSAAMVNYPQTILDLVRVGIMQYGLWPSKETLVSYLSKMEGKTDPLKRIISWKSRVMAVKEVSTGEFVGYGNTFMAENNMKTAIVPVGYSDGYSRALSNQGWILIRGHRVNVIGMVNMNMLLADISHIPGVEKGDEVVLIGEQDKLTISVASFGELSNQLNYELLTRLPFDIPRIVTK